MEYKLSNNYEQMYHSAVHGCWRYLLQNKSIKSLIIGVSGGIDSAVVCMLAKAACDNLFDRKVILIGRSIAIESNTDEEIKRAKAIGNHFCDEFQHIGFTEQYKLLRNRIIPQNIITHEQKVRAGNIKARLRMIYLYNLASEHNGLVLGTDNLTEYMLGFWTLHGDVGDLGLIQNLWKTEVYGLADWWIGNSKNGRRNDEKADALMSCVKAIPTDGLGITDSDLDQLLPDGYLSLDFNNPVVSYFRHTQGYRQIDNTLIDYITENVPHRFPKPSAKHGSVIERHLQTQFKRNNPVNVDRKLLVT